MARVLLLSPYHGGSHAAFAAGLAAHSRHTFTPLTLPARFWKWRLRGAALLLADRARRTPRPDVILATDMLNLAEFRALSGLADVPCVLYMHENQLCYPLPSPDRGDAGFGFVNIASALAARVVIFNSRYHRDAFFGALPGFLQAMPDCPLPAAPLRRLREISRVLPVGCEIEHLRSVAGRDLQSGSAATLPAGAPLILWNHRWEFDKAPEVFFDVLGRLDDAGRRFRLALVGENGQVEPKPFLAARERYGSRVIQFGWLPRRDDYARLLGAADLVISTARQENFGVSVVEAVACGAWPLLPRRLAYPEVLPRAWHHACLYRDTDELALRLSGLLQKGLPAPASRAALAAAMDGYDWSALIGTYDDLLEGVAGGQEPLDAV